MRKYLQIITTLSLFWIVSLSCSQHSTSPEQPATSVEEPLITLQNNGLRHILAAKYLRMDTTSGQINVLPDRVISFGEHSLLDVGGIPGVDVKYHLVAVDENFNASWQANNGVVNPEKTRRNMAVRFKFQLLNQDTENSIFAPRAIFIPLSGQFSGPPGDSIDPNYNSVHLASADGLLNLDLLPDYEDALPPPPFIPPQGPYYYQRVVNGNGGWVLGKVGSTTPPPQSAEIECQIIIPYDPLDPGLPKLIDWLVIFDGENNIETCAGVRPFGIGNLKIKRHTSNDAYYDKFWDLNIIRIDDDFDLSIDLFKDVITPFDPLNYSVALYRNDLFVTPLVHQEPDESELVHYLGSGLGIGDIFGTNQPWPATSGMYDFEVRVTWIGEPGEEGFYLTKWFKFPFVIPLPDTTLENIFSSGFYIIAGVGPNTDEVGGDTRLTLSNSFTREKRVATDGSIPTPVPLTGMSDISLQKYVGAIEDGTVPLRVAYYDPISIRVWGWDSAGSGHEALYPLDGDGSFGSNPHWGLCTEPQDLLAPYLDPYGQFVLWSSKYPGIPKTGLGYPFDYKPDWMIYDGYGSTFDGTLHITDQGNQHIYQFDFNDLTWMTYDPDIVHYTNRCGGRYGGLYPLTPYQDGNWLMAPSVSGPTYFNNIPDGSSGFHYVTVFPRSGDCGQEYTSLLIYFYQYDDINKKFYNVNMVEFCPSGYCENVIWGDVATNKYYSTDGRPDVVGKHSGTETHFTNAMIAPDASSIVYEAYENGVNRIYKVDIKKLIEVPPGKFISDSYQVGMAPAYGAQQFKPVINTSFFNPFDPNPESQVVDLPLDIIAYQDGLDSGTDIWLAIQLPATPPQHSFFRINLTGPFGLDLKAYSGQPDMSTRFPIYEGDPYMRTGLVFTSQNFDQGDLILIDNVFSFPGNNWTKIRRMTNYGEVQEVKISDYIPIRGN